MYLSTYPGDPTLVIVLLLYTSPLSFPLLLICAPPTDANYNPATSARLANPLTATAPASRVAATSLASLRSLSRTRTRSRFCGCSRGAAKGQPTSATTGRAVSSTSTTIPAQARLRFASVTKSRPASCRSGTSWPRVRRAQLSQGRPERAAEPTPIHEQSRDTSPTRPS